MSIPGPENVGPKIKEVLQIRGASEVVTEGSDRGEQAC